MFENPDDENKLKYRPISNLIEERDPENISDWRTPMDGVIKKFRFYLSERFYNNNFMLMYLNI